MFKVIITGGKDFTDYELLSRKLDRILSNSHDVEICISDRRGAEKQAKKYAQKNKLKLTIFNIDWNKGRYAGSMILNEMLSYADAIVVFDNEEDAFVKSILKQSEYHHCQKRIIKYQSKELWSQKPATETQLAYIRQIRSQNLRAPRFEGKTVADAGLYIRKWA